MHLARTVIACAALVMAAGCSSDTQPATSAPHSPTPVMVSKAFDQDLTTAGIPQSAHLTLESWAMSACQTLPKMGMSDREIIANLPGDVAPNNVTLTTEQAEKVWASAKVNVCGLPRSTVLPSN